MEAPPPWQMRPASGADSSVQYAFYQPAAHRWRETDFFPCSVTCGGGESAALRRQGRSQSWLTPGCGGQATS